MPVRAIVTASALFAIEENSVRVALSRLTSAGMVEKTERGGYRLGPQAAGVQERVVSWRCLADRLVPWDQSWIAVHSLLLTRASRRAMRARTRALSLNGFKPFRGGWEIRPNNLAGGVNGMRGTLIHLGLDPSAPVFKVSDLDEATANAACALWKADHIRNGYRSTIETLKKSERALAMKSADEAMVETFKLGGAAIRQLVLDPLLPDEIVPACERVALIEALEHYDRLGRECWTALLSAHGVVKHQAPADTRHLYNSTRFPIREQGWTS